MVVILTLARYGVTAGMDAFANSVASGVEGVLVRYYSWRFTPIRSNLTVPDETHRRGGVRRCQRIPQGYWQRASWVSEISNNFRMQCSIKPNSVVTKPVIGVFDLAANVSEGMYLRKLHRDAVVLITGLGIRNTTTVFDNPARERVRLVSVVD